MPSLVRPSPRVDADSRKYWQAAAEKRRALPQCLSCGMINFPPRPRCKHCLSTHLVWIEVSGRGLINSFVVMHVSAIEGFETPYVVVQVAIEEQPNLMMIGNLLDCPIGEVEIGQQVETVYESRADGSVVPQFARCSVSPLQRAAP